MLSEQVFLPDLVNLSCGP